MKAFITPAYTFTPGASGVGTINLSGITGFDIKKLAAVINQTRGIVIYSTASEALKYTALAGSTLTLFLDTAAHASTDVLQVVYEVDSLNPLTNTELRAAAVPVSGPLTDAQIRATALPVSGPLTDAQLRAATLPVSGTFWQATQPVSIASAPAPAVSGGAITHAQKTVGTVAVRATVDGLAPSASRKKLIIKPSANNTGKIFLGSSTVTTANSLEIVGPDRMEFEFDSGDYYVISDVAGQIVEILEKA